VAVDVRKNRTKGCSDVSQLWTSRFHRQLVCQLQDDMVDLDSSPNPQGEPNIFVIRQLVCIPLERHESIQTLFACNLPDGIRGRSVVRRTEIRLVSRLWSDNQFTDVPSDVGGSRKHSKGEATLFNRSQDDRFVEH
jgi:hypothetical protein